LTTPITLSASYFTVTIGSAEIPFCFTQVNSNNNVLDISINGVAHTVTFPIGNYNINSLCEYLKNAILGIDVGCILVYSYNKDQGKVGLVVPVGKTLVLGFSNNEALGSMFGFVSDATITSVLTTSVRHVNVCPSPCLYIRSENLSLVNSREWLVQSDVNSDILCKIQLTEQPGSWIFFAGTGLETRLSNSVIDRISLYLGDSLNYLVDLGGLDWSCRITFNEYLIDYVAPDNTQLPDMQELLTQRNQLAEELAKMKEDLQNQEP
jgi:hypothetical protein